jgi:hypothetical protein
MRAAKEREEHEGRRRGGKVNDHDADDGYRRGGGVEKKKRDHEKLATGGGVISRKRGGGIKPETAKLDAEGTGDNYPEVGSIRERGHHEISVQKRRGGKVEGKKPPHRGDRRARGGSVPAARANGGSVPAAPAAQARARGGAVHGGAAPSQGSKVSHSAPKRPAWPYSGADVADPHYTRGSGPEATIRGKGRDKG